MRADVIEIIHADIDGGEGLLAVIFQNSHRDNRGSTEGPLFITPPRMSLQGAFMRYQANKMIEAHTHPTQRRVIEAPTSEVIIVMKGRVLADIFLSSGKKHSSHFLNEGDVLMQFAGGHGFLMIEDSEIIEIKQGPYDPNKDKVRFNASA